MYCLNDMCCICLGNEEILHNLSVINSDEITHYVKLISCIPEMCFNEINDERLSCTECLNNIDMFYKFRQKCLKSKSILIDYFTKQHLTSNEIDHVSDCLTHISKIEEIYVKEELNIQENVEEKPGLESLFELNINEDENNKNCHKRYLENVMSRVNNISVNLNEIEPNFNVLGNINIKMEPNDNLSDSMGTMEHDYLQGNPENHLQIKALHSGLDAICFDETKKEKQTRPSSQISKFEVSSADTTKSRKMRHAKNKLKEKTFECTICKKKFIQSTDLKRHMRVHTGERPYECTVCKKTFSQPSHLKTHTKIHTYVHLYTEETHECSVCTKKFIHLANLTNHMKTHVEVNPHECTVCKKTFKKPSHLSRHMNVHTGDKPHECGVCKKKFSQSSNLTKHMRIHTGEKTYECTVCNKAFNQAAHLSSHMKIHTGELLHECTVCQKKFSMSYNLTRHMKIH